MFDKRIYEFQCNKWLSGQDGDRKIYRELKLDRERGFVDGTYQLSRVPWPEQIEIETGIL